MSVRRTQLTVVVAGLLLLAIAVTPGLQAPAGAQEGKTDVEGIVSPAALLGGEIQISPPSATAADRHVPSVAHNSKHDEYLVVWHNTWPGGHRDIYARRVTDSGRLLSWFAVSAGPNDRAQPAVAYNATRDEYLVVWMYNANNDKSTFEIWGRIVSWNGAQLGPEFQIISWPNRTFYTPRAVWNGRTNEYLVVWNAHDATTLQPTDIAHAILSHTGAKLYGAIISAADQPHQIDVTYNVANDEFLAVWRRMWNPGDGDIRAARIEGFGGQVVTPPGVFTVNASTEDQMFPSVATNGQNRYIVVWQHAFPGPCCDWDIRAQEVDQNGGLVGSWFYLSSSSDDETVPRVAARAGPRREYMAVWQRTTTGGETIRGRWWSGNTGTAIPLIVADYAFWDVERPAIAAGSTGFLTVYTGDAQGDPTVQQHIYGRIWTRNNAFLPLLMRKH